MSNKSKLRDRCYFYIGFLETIIEISDYLIKPSIYDGFIKLKNLLQDIAEELKNE